MSAGGSADEAVTAMDDATVEPVVPDPAQIEEAYRRGLEEGRAQGREEVRRQLAADLALVAELSRQWHRLVSQALQHAEVTIVRLAYEIAKKIIRQEIQANPDLIQFVVREAVRRISNASRAVISLNPADLERLEGESELFRELRESVEHITLRGDESISPGGCTVDTDVGFVDATLESQLEEIERSLFGESADAA